jgi:hypothetical protein
MDTIAKLKELNLPAGQYAVIGSGTLAVRGIREARDLDIVAQPAVFEELKRRGGWKRKWFFRGFLTRRVIQKDGVEIFSNYHYKKFRPLTEDIIQGADIIEGFPFISLEDYVAFKKELGREKDMRDIQPIEAYMAKQK